MLSEEKAFPLVLFSLIFRTHAAKPIRFLSTTQNFVDEFPYVKVLPPPSTRSLVIHWTGLFICSLFFKYSFSYVISWQVSVAIDTAFDSLERKKEISSSRRWWCIVRTIPPPHLPPPPLPNWNRNNPAHEATISFDDSKNYSCRSFVPLYITLIYPMIQRGQYLLQF